MSSRPITGQPGDVFRRQMDHSVLGNRRMAVTQDPSLVKIRSLFLADLGSDLVKWLRPPGGHGKGDRNLFFG